MRLIANSNITNRLTVRLGIASAIYQGLSPESEFITFRKVLGLQFLGINIRTAQVALQ